MEPTQDPGTIGWIDLTVPDADRVRDFYAEVVGWHPEPVDMDGYSDFVMKSPGGAPAAGVCHARGTNAGCWGMQSASGSCPGTLQLRSDSCCRNSAPGSPAQFPGCSP